jgi:TolB-like protein/Tfp pilus assembly protein PilF
MSSIIEGYNYDIFISYRQKDNKHDGWVTEFVDNLKGELESTFKEEISVYFDINPHDGILETHDVDASLKDKLKCLVFIPIISQTYCDSKSYAWEHEFVAFNKMAKEDQFGRDIRLAGGNVASRILPIKINDVDPEDKTLLENEIGGILRSIEFIYKSAGVNRPLRANEDHPQDNLNKSYYRDQINKVANAVKEIITALRKHDQHEGEVRKEIVITRLESHKNPITKIIIASVLVLILILSGYFLIPKLARTKDHLEKSIAILPFKLLSNETDKQYLADGTMDEITLHLSKIKELRVLGRTSTEQYRNSTKTTTTIGHELGVSYLLEGSFQKFGDNARLIVQLIKTGKEGHVWANDYDRNWSDIFKVQSEVAQKVADELNAAITPEEKQLINLIPTTNLTAYDFYQQGREVYWDNYFKENREALERSEDLFRKALQYDPKFAQAYSGLAMVYWDKYTWKNIFTKYYLDSILVLSNIALVYDDHLSEAYLAKGFYYDAIGKKEQAIEEFERAIKYNPNDWIIYLGSSAVYYNYDFVKALENYQKAISLKPGSHLPTILRRICNVFNQIGFPDKAKQYLQDALKLDRDTLTTYRNLSSIEFNSGNFTKANELDKKYYLKDTTDASNYFDLGSSYMFLRQPDKTLYYYEKYLQKKGKEITLYDLYGLHRIAWAFFQRGDKKKSEFYLNECIENCEKVKQLGRGSQFYPLRYDYNLAAAYALKGDKKKAYENLNEWASGRICSLWGLIFLKYDPLFDSIRNESEFLKIVSEMEAKYQAEHERVRRWLEENKML